MCIKSPIDLFKSNGGGISKQEYGKYSITIGLDSFEWDNEIIETDIRMDFIDFKNLDLKNLVESLSKPCKSHDGLACLEF